MPVRWPASQDSKQELKNNYQGFDMSPDRTVIHVLFFVGKSGQPTVLPLTDAYEVVVYPSEGPPDIPPFTLEIAPSSRTSSRQQLDVASFTTLYGENGSGKTEMLLGVCEGLADWESKSKVSILWETEQGLYLSKGLSLNKTRLLSSLQITQDKFCVPPDFSAVFYSTSPFEKVRRALLRRRKVKDVSPRFGLVVESEMVAAFNAYPFLKDKATFVSEATAEIKLKPASLVDLVKSYSADGARTYKALEPEMKTRLHEIDRRSSVQTRFICSFAVLECLDRVTDEQLHLLIDTLLAMIKVHGPWLNDLLLVDFPQLLLLAGNDFLAEQLLKARNALDVVRPLFKNVNTWRRLASLAYLDEQAGHQIRQHEGVFSEVAALGLLKFSFKQLSSGQASMMSLYCSTARAFGEFERESQDRLMLLCIDEGEMFMHPKWQRMYIDSLLKFIGQFGSLAKRTHVFISTHSLIVAADTPAGRLFDLDNQQLTNAFGYTPKQTLNSVFAVGDFTGEFNLNLLTKLSDVLNRKDQDLESIRHAWQIADTLANDELRHHVQQQLSVLIGGPHAQA
ncbi:AAA family ATPase [Pseudomonas protegens]|uniref:AAA family ATPase n=1 Tax=Pseudomonas TaxID=286 RepID=UPI0013723429|nr:MULTISPECIES: AAA family ATPase [Pseudomonas]MDS9873999.1 AAA family ATPase [Pseudomonas protegens]MDT9642753.1 ATP-binding protein [Pseudomonas sp. JV245A]NAN53493.1 hypothetical protein [Pseudomonas protegens]NUE77821.1 hypothetical protein [Pseudomonas protegens]